MLISVLSVIKKYNLLSFDDTVVLGISGGADSVCLFHILLLLSKEFNLHIVPVHVNHGIRGAEADDDEIFVQNLCGAFSIKPLFFHVDVKKLALKNKIGLEEAGRAARYNCFDLVTEKLQSESFRNIKIAVAHNRNDNLETILMNLFRSTGLTGLCGIKPLHGRIIRPLIETDRKEIEKFLKERQISYRIDSSNETELFTRNIFRRKIIPYISSTLNINLENKILSSCEIIREENDFMEQQAETFFTANKKISGNEIFIPIQPLAELHKALLSRVIRFAISHWSLKDVSRVHIENIINLLRATVGAKVNLPNKIIVRRGYNELIFSHADLSVKKYKSFCYTLPSNKFIYVPEINLTFYLTLELSYITQKQNPCTKIFARDKIMDAIVNIRSRLTGDNIRVSSIGSIKIKKYFINEKIPQAMRSQIGLIAIGSDVIWILDKKNFTNEKYECKTDSEKCFLLYWRGKFEGE